MPFFISRRDASTNNFKTHFDKASQTDLFFESAYTLSNKIYLGAGVHYYITQPDLLEHAYYHPDFKMTLSGKYRIFERLLLGAEFYFYSKMWAVSTDGPDEIAISHYVKLPPCYDLNVSAEYRIWQELYLFLQANNVFAQNYERYLNYPTQGLNIIGGIRFRF
jgi:outer membrane receptor protein involved in Fe transport